MVACPVRRLWFRPSAEPLRRVDIERPDLLDHVLERRGGQRPDWRKTIWPFLKAISVGMAWIWRRRSPARPRCRPWRRRRRGAFPTPPAYVGANARQGPHQDAQKSTNTISLSVMVALNCSVVRSRVVTSQRTRRQVVPSKPRGARADTPTDPTGRRGRRTPFAVCSMRSSRGIRARYANCSPLPQASGADGARGSGRSVPPRRSHGCVRLQARDTASVGHYIADVRDPEFNLFEVLDIGAVLGTGRYSDLDVDAAKTILTGAATWPKDRWPRLLPPPTATHRCSPRHAHISVSPELAKTVEAIKEAGFWRLGLDEEIGGTRHHPRWRGASPNCFFAPIPPPACLPGHLHGPGAVRRGHRGTAALGGRGCRARLGGDHGAHRTRRGLRRRAAPPKPSNNPTAPGTSKGLSVHHRRSVGDTAENVYHLVLARPEAPARAPKG